MNTPTFHSSLKQHISDLVSFKRMQGFDYSAQAKCLYYLDAFLCEQRYQDTSLNRRIVEAYVSETAHLAPNARYTRLSIVRVLSRHLHLFGPESYVLHHLPVQRPSLPRWFLYSPHDIASLLCHARTFRPARSLHPHCFHLLLGLLYVSGLRIGEALALNLGDLDTNRGLLFVRNGKFGKKRYLALDQSTILVVQDYLSYRTAYLPSGENAPLFLNQSGKRLPYSQTARTFRRMATQCGIGVHAPQPPRLHDLRHTYACNCLLKWYNEGADVNAKLPVLATAMGHVNIESTQIYLHVTSQLLDQAKQRFHATFSSNCKGD